MTTLDSTISSKNIIITQGLHKLRQTNGHIVGLHTFSPDDNKFHLFGYEIQEWSNDRQEYIACGFFVSLSDAQSLFEKYFNIT